MVNTYQLNNLHYLFTFFYGIVLLNILLSGNNIDFFFSFLLALQLFFDAAL